MKTPFVLILVTVAVNFGESLAQRSPITVLSRAQRQVNFANRFPSSGPSRNNGFPLSHSNGRFPSNFDQPSIRQDRNRPNVPQWIAATLSSTTRPQRQNAPGSRGPQLFPPPNRFEEPRQEIGNPRDESDDDDDDRFVFDVPTSAGPPPRRTSVGPPPRWTTTSTSTTPRSQAQVDATDSCITNCQTTSEFNPVCGSDQVTYTNPGRLKCAVMCGRGVSLGHYGNCITTTAAPSSTARSLRRA